MPVQAKADGRTQLPASEFSVWISKRSCRPAIVPGFSSYSCRILRIFLAQSARMFTLEALLDQYSAKQVDILLSTSKYWNLCFYKPSKLCFDISVP